MSIYQKNPHLICLGASFVLRAGDQSEIKAKMAQNMASRREKQPLEYPSAGSYFKRPDGHFAGKLIEDCGLKGMRVGGAEVSAKHAGFIINVDDATYYDVLNLEEKIKERVYQTFGISLEREVKLIAD
jgi:UDP-N-acetylmuramate dehydrogenase